MNQRRAITFLSLKTQFENIGDALINRELLRLVANESDVEVDLSRCPPSFARNMLIDGKFTIHNVASSAALFLRMFLAGFRGRRRYYFLSPGGYVGERGGMQFVQGLANTLALAGLWLAGVRICHVGVSYERLGKLQRSLLRWRNPLLYRHIVRDRLSCEYARSLGLRVDGQMPDLAFGAVGELEGSATVREFVALSFRVDQSSDLEATIAEVISELDESLPGDIPFKLVCQVRRDAVFLKKVKENVRRRRVVYVDAHDSIDMCFRAYDDCEYIVSNRLHALLIGTIRGARPVALLSKDVNAKVYGTLSALGIGDNIVELDIGASPQICKFIQEDQQLNIDIEKHKEALSNTFHSIFQHA